MPVSICPLDVQRQRYESHGRTTPAITSEKDLLFGSVDRKLSMRCTEIFQSSFREQLQNGSLHANRNSFVHTVTQAYNTHHDLVLRPDDVWLAILIQFNFYVNAHAEELRHLFVAHEGKKKLVVYAVGTRYTVDFGAMAHRMGELIQENVTDPDLREWIIPDFSTTQVNDKVVASVVMMATLKAYISYGFTLRCGLPKVTLLGERDDWARLITKIDKLKTFGPDTAYWYTFLEPVLRRFVDTFDDPTKSETKDFWNRVCHYTGGGSGPTYLTGWITAFCFFTPAGKALCYNQAGKPQNAKYIASHTWGSSPEAVLDLDGTLYHRIDTEDIPNGYAEVDVKLDDNGTLFDTVMVAGLVGVGVSDSNVPETQEKREAVEKPKIDAARKALEEQKAKKQQEEWELQQAQYALENAIKISERPLHDGKGDVIQPISGWWLFHVGPHASK
ncbi:hypothetical protein FRB97_004457 [Tulasnella sp. 331]|nr:hypothetical protein FRB97_004457 [Tulasnella sp. 331]KAG8881679.1 hypothetical protein FRB98_004208 [Tulasnella sp. 332]